MHIMSRGNNRQTIFKGDEEKSYFCYLLYSNKSFNGVHVYHYCLMGNHIHLIIHLDLNSNLPRFIKQVLLAYYSLYRNNHEHVGHLFQGRYKSILIDTHSYLSQCGKYIELNPVRAKIVEDPADYVHSSYHFYARGADDPLITPDPFYLGMGETEAQRQAAYREMVIDPGMVNSEKLRTHRFLGSDEFVKRMEAQFGIRNVGLKRGRPSKEKTETSPFC